MADISNILGTASDIAGAVSGTAGAIKGVASLLGFGGGMSQADQMKAQYKYQRLLNEQQQEYARENATTAFNRQYQLTRDNPVLQVEGMKNAGINPATLNGGSTASASSVSDAASPNAGSVSLPQSDSEQQYQAMQGLSSSVAMLNQTSTTHAQNRLTNAQAETAEIDNQTRAIENIHKLTKLRSDAKDATERARLDRLIADNYALFGTRQQEAHTKKVEADSDEARSRANMAQQDEEVHEQSLQYDLNKKLADLQLALAQGRLTRQEYFSEVKKLELMDSEIRKNDATSTNLQASTNGINLDNQLKFYTMSDKLVISFEEANQSKLRTEGLRLANLPRSMSEAWSREAQFALQRIQKGKGSAHDWALISSETAREYYFYTTNEAKDWAKIILGALPGSSSGAASSSTPGYIVNTSVPQYSH